jgi:hypothetical protein
MTHDIAKIKAHLLKHPEYFCEDNSASTIDDVIFFKKRKANNIIFKGEEFLCDIYSNEIWIVRLLDKPKFDPIRKQKLGIEAVSLVVDDCQKKFYTFNGYWVIPKFVEAKDGVK